MTKFVQAIVENPLFNFFVGVLIAFFVGTLTAQLARKRLPVAYSIAVVGFPRSGKTSLITSIFGELFARRVLGYDVFPRGESTIERVNDDLAKLELGESLGPTTDQDLFAYRADVVRRKVFFSSTYKVEIGDFPGEDSAAFAGNFGAWFHQTPYFKWVMEADAFIFVIDVANILDPDLSREYSARVSKAIRAAWQRIQENHLQGERALFSKPVALVFMKADLFGVVEKSALGGEPARPINQKVMRLGLGEGVPVPVEVDPDALRIGRAACLEQFEELIDYLSSQSKNLCVEFASAFAYQYGRRLGIKELLGFILPRPGRISTRRRPRSPNSSPAADGLRHR